MCKRTMYKRARIPMFLWERRACANSGAQAVFPRPRKNGLGTRLARHLRSGAGRPMANWQSRALNFGAQLVVCSAVAKPRLTGTHETTGS